MVNSAELTAGCPTAELAASAERGSCRGRTGCRVADSSSGRGETKGGQAVLIGEGKNLGEVSSVFFFSQYVTFDSFEILRIMEKSCKEKAPKK